MCLIEIGLRYQNMLIIQCNRQHNSGNLYDHSMSTKIFTLIIIAQTSLPNNNCLCAWPIYCPILNLTRHSLCLSKIVGFVHKLFDKILSIYLFISHLYSWCVWFVIIYKLFLLSNLMTCFPRCQTGLLSNVSCIK